MKKPGTDPVRWQKAELEYVRRTAWHIKLVQEAAAKLVMAGAVDGEDASNLLRVAAIHDHLKFDNLEYSAYVYWWHYLSAEEREVAGEYTPYERALKHHYRLSPHHLEHWANEDGAIDFGRVTRHHLAEMVCDWAAMAWERGTSLQQWAFEKVEEHKELFKKFKKYAQFIMKLVGVLEPDPKDHTGPIHYSLLHQLPNIHEVSEVNGVCFKHAYRGFGVKVGPDVFGIAQRDGGLEIVRDGKILWNSQYQAANHLYCPKCGRVLTVAITSHYSRVPLFSDGFDVDYGKHIGSEEESQQCECGWEWFIDTDEEGRLTAQGLNG